MHNIARQEERVVAQYHKQFPIDETWRCLCHGSDGRPFVVYGELRDWVAMPGNPNRWRYGWRYLFYRNGELVPKPNHFGGTPDVHYAINLTECGNVPGKGWQGPGHLTVSEFAEIVLQPIGGGRPTEDTLAGECATRVIVELKCRAGNAVSGLFYTFECANTVRITCGD